MIGLESYPDICNIFQGMIIFVLFTKNVKKKRKKNNNILLYIITVCQLISGILKCLSTRHKFMLYIPPDQINISC